jgi:signal transduction histidine kinase
VKRSLKGKFILSYLVIALITVLVVSALIRLTSGQSLMNMVVDQQTTFLTEVTQDYYTTNGSLDGFFAYYSQTYLSHPNPGQPDTPGKPPESQDTRGVHGLVDADYRALIPTFGYEPGQTVPQDKIKDPQPVKVNGKTIAYVLPDTKFQFKLSAEEQLFLKRTNLAIGLAALAGIVAAVGMGFFLSGRLVKPIRRLTKASRSLAKGNLQQQVPVTSQDELGQLTTTFNKMSADLFQADQQRKRLTADITHDLSTPLQIISGYIEMLETRETTLTPQRIEIIKTEIEHLRRLVGDLSTLTQVEAGGLEIQVHPILPRVLLERVYRAYQPIAARQNISLELDTAVATAEINVDDGRMLQVLKNLIENAMRYTPEKGTIKLRAKQDAQQVQLIVEDNGSGIDADDLPYVFERFYRTDKAREGNSGKMGLGLAICKALVTAQGGQIAADSAGKGQGTKIIVTFAPAS